jgi:NAD(P)-dependent dehydrogenase (short-subunit alcohol dehydrogenase family)
MSEQNSLHTEARDFRDQPVLITGGAGGVGLACAKAFAKLGARLLLIGRTDSSLQEACLELRGDYGIEADSACGDISDSEFANHCFDLTEKLYDRPAFALINNAGVIVREAAASTSDEDWQSVMDTNVSGLFYCSRAFAQRGAQGGTIINISSTCGQVGSAGLAAYCASKGAVNQLTRAMALELTERGITVNAVAPGAIDSPMLFSNHASQALADSVIERNKASIPSGDVASPEEIARAVAFVAGERHMTGTILSIDGGYTAA